jgi:acyl-CoA thioester hydrolase
MNFSPKTYDIDALGIVSNITYVRWLEDMRTEYLHENLPWDRLKEEGLAPVLVETNIQYKKPVKMAEEIEGKLRVIEVGRTSWRLQFEFTRGTEVVLTAKQKGMFVDMDSGNPKRLPEDLRSNMKS